MEEHKHTEEELEEDYARFAALSDVEDLNEPLFKSVSKRLPWLFCLLLLSLIVSATVGLFENVVKHVSLIVNFQSLVLAMAGNVGTQSLSVTIRVITETDLNLKQRFHLVLKEAKVGFLNGILLGIFSFVLIGIYLSFFMGESINLAFGVSLCTALAMALSMLLSSVSGTSVPLIFKSLKVDPAVASGPLITTLNDLVAVVSYYSIAYLLLLGTKTI